MKIGMVGSDSRAWKKNSDGEEKAKKVIQGILQGYEVEPYLKGDSRVAQLWIYNRESEITVVSGHCPVGEERWYCVDCNVWLSLDDTNKVKWEWKECKEPSHRKIKVYDQGGVDTWAEIIATELGLKKEIYPAEVHQWNDDCITCAYMDPMRGHVVPTKRCIEKVHRISKGYRSRNIQIAEACDVLYDIEPAGSCTRCKGTGSIMWSPPYYNYVTPGNVECPKCEGDGAYSGGTWVLKYARKLGREVHKAVIS